MTHFKTNGTALPWSSQNLNKQNLIKAHNLAWFYKALHHITLCFTILCLAKCLSHTRKWQGSQKNYSKEMIKSIVIESPKLEMASLGPKNHPAYYIHSQRLKANSHTQTSKPKLCMSLIQSIPDRYNKTKPK